MFDAVGEISATSTATSDLRGSATRIVVATGVEPDFYEPASPAHEPLNPENGNLFEELEDEAREVAESGGRKEPTPCPPDAIKPPPPPAPPARRNAMHLVAVGALLLASACSMDVEGSYGAGPYRDYCRGALSLARTLADTTAIIRQPATASGIDLGPACAQFIGAERRHKAVSVGGSR